LGTSTKPHTAVEEMPVFIGGEKELFKFLGQNIRYTETARENKIGGISYIYFVIAPDGSVVNAKVYKGVKGGADLDAEALRVVKMMPKWIPGKQNGNPVFVQMIVPVKFVVH
jgi:TonB family protein